MHTVANLCNERLQALATTTVGLQWILMVHDRTGDKTLPLTNEFLSLMLGVRRAGVTEALQSLKRQKLIENG
jgi:CRP-like cAMP-binding protein